MSDQPRQYVPLTCHGHSRPVPHIEFSPLEKEEVYYLISACKDNNPMLRDGQTGDWIGTFIGHKGAVWQARLSPDSSKAATASADFTAKIWNTQTGELLLTIQHDHIVRAIAYPPDNSILLATGGMEKRLRIFDLSSLSVDDEPSTMQASQGFEIGAGTHTASIKFIAWTRDVNTLVTASDNTLRWFDVSSRSLIHSEVLDGEIKSCELVSLAPAYTDESDIGGGQPVLAVAAGKFVYFWGGLKAMDELKRMDVGFKVASVGLDLKNRKIVVGEDPGTWARGHHGPIWSIGFSPDNKLYATASEDGTIKMWKNCDGFYGLWKGGSGGANGNGSDKTAE
ncbi:hypothetical protein TD95_002568 [Thielaviopsis punctulata]|uniref:Serine-threonine kinase receptor-associated protein n=1 Tax=Thielaviopsis punctulata TaxID=72032 RepID=A0A0F4ZKJ2_9PEZI|nr:hypothetical protein TD95_002568 [Thielaviopsis punctulata]